MSESQDFQERIARIEGMIRKLESSADPSLRTTARELVQTLMELHGAGMGRIMESIAEEGDVGARLLKTLGQDPLVGSLLILYNLHPEDFETRLQRGLDKVRSILRKQGATLNVLTANESRIHVRIVGAHAEDVQAAVRNIFFEAVPDVADVVIEGGQQMQSGFVPVESLLTAGAANSRP